MKSNQIRIRVSSRRGILPFGSIDTKVDKKHLDKVLVFVIELMAQDEATVQTELSSVTKKEHKDDSPREA